MKKYPSIEQFRHVIKKVRTDHDYKGKDENEEPVYNHDSDYPIINFKAHVKKHGTNAAIHWNKGSIAFQSRNNIITVQNDNFGFVAEMSKLNNMKALFDFFAETLDDIVLYGEWCGKGIQENVALSQVDRMFVIFAAKINDKWADIPKSFAKYRKRHGCCIWSNDEFPNWNFEIDFNSPEIAQNAIIEKTIEVENECPIGKYFGISGTGEGIVLEAFHNGQHYIFKSKGEKHSSSKVTKLANIDIEKIKNIKQFVFVAVTTNRLKQGLENIEVRNVKHFIDWMIRDVFKEENDTIVQNNLDAGMIAKEIGNVARKWFLEYCNKA